MTPLARWTTICGALALLLAAGEASAQAVSANTVPVQSAAPTANAPVTLQSLAQPATVNAGDASSQQHLAPMALKLADATPITAAIANPPSQSTPAPVSATTLHLVVGRSLFVELPEKLPRIYVSNPAVLDAMTSTPQEVVITAKSAGVSSLILWTVTSQPKLFT